MAKSAAQKAEAAAAKAEAKPTTANIAAAAKAEAKAAVVASNPNASNKEIKQAGNAAAKEVKDTVSTLTNSQKLEVKALKQEGAKSEVKDEKVANAQEKEALLRAMVANGFAAPAQEGPLRTQASTYDATTGGGLEAINRVIGAADLRQQYDIDPMRSTGGYSTSGISDIRLDKALASQDPTTGLFAGNSPVAKTLNVRQGLQALQESGAPITSDAVRQVMIDAGVKDNLADRKIQRLDKRGVINFGDRSGGDQNYTTMAFTRDEAGNLVPGSIGKTMIDTPKQGGMLGTLGTIANIAQFIPGMQWVAPFATGLNVANAIDTGNPLSLALAAVGASNLAAGDFAGAANAYAEAGYSASDIAGFLQESGVNAASAQTLAHTAALNSAISSGAGKLFDSGKAALGMDQVGGLNPPSGYDYNPADLMGPMPGGGNLNDYSYLPDGFVGPELPGVDLGAPINITTPPSGGLSALGQDAYTPPTGDLTQVPAPVSTSVPKPVSNEALVTQNLQRLGLDADTAAKVAAGLGGAGLLGAATGAGGAAEESGFSKWLNEAGGDIINTIGGTGGKLLGMGAGDIAGKLMALFMANQGLKGNENVEDALQRSKYFKQGLGQAQWAGPQQRNVLRGGWGGGQAYNLFAEGGLARYVQGSTAGQADKVPAMLSDGEYVFDAETVAALGDGNNEAGAHALDQMRENIRRHKRNAPTNKIPPKAKRPEQYLKKGAK